MPYLPSPDEIDQLVVMGRLSPATAAALKARQGVMAPSPTAYPRGPAPVAPSGRPIETIPNFAPGEDQRAWSEAAREDARLRAIAAAPPTSPPLVAPSGRPLQDLPEFAPGEDQRLWADGRDARMATRSVPASGKPIDTIPTFAAGEDQRPWSEAARDNARLLAEAEAAKKKPIDKYDDLVNKVVAMRRKEWAPTTVSYEQAAKRRQGG